MEDIPPEARRGRARRSSRIRDAVAGLIWLTLLGCRPPSGAEVAAHPAAAPPPFRDVAREVGVEFAWGHGGKSPLDILETLGSGCAFLDYDQDGLMDLLLVGTPRCALYRNTGGRFTEVSAQAGLTSQGRFFGVAVGDYDNDGYPDLYLTGYGKCVLYHNTGLGSFSDVTAGSGLAAPGPFDVATAAAFVDLDNDGKLDLFAGRYIVFTPKSIRYCRYQGVLSGCGVKNYQPDLPRVYRNLGNGSFQEMTRAWGFQSSHGKCLGVAVRAADEGRGVLLYAANDELPGDYFLRRGDRYVNVGTSSGTAFNLEGLTQAGMGTDWGDFDSDGRPDLVVATFHTEANSLYRNEGGNLYTDVSGPLGIAATTTSYVAWTARFLDYDNDGWQDLFFTNGHVQDNVHLIQTDRTYPQPMQLFRNERGISFREVSREAGPDFTRGIVGRGAAFGDYDNDGRTDILVVNAEGSPLLLQNEGGAGEWLGVRLVGRQSNRDGIGARVTLTAGGRILTRDLQLAGGYLSAHDPRLLFGLGEVKEVDSIRVRWPNGELDRVERVRTSQYVTIIQGQGAVSSSG